MEDKSSEPEDSLVADPKFQRFATSIDRALKGFEVTKEWHDLISCLARLHKVYIPRGEGCTNVLSIGPLGVFSFHGRAVQSPDMQEIVTVSPSQLTRWSTS